MYFHIMVGTGSYTTSTTNMYNKDFTHRLSRPRRQDIHGLQLIPDCRAQRPTTKWKRQNSSVSLYLE